ncbi:hypothetical protein HYU13_01650, partial [Candidatus Woesearchaeota archaeon]|nr:hypothetical protein [Candidatus Woesearchaeota archaeon]
MVGDLPLKAKMDRVLPLKDIILPLKDIILPLKDAKDDDLQLKVDGKGELPNEADRRGALSLMAYAKLCGFF